MEIEFVDEDIRVLAAILEYLGENGYKAQRTLVPYQVHIVFDGSPGCVLTVARGLAVVRYAGDFVLRQPLADPGALPKILEQIKMYHRLENDSAAIILNIMDQNPPYDGGGCQSNV